MSVATLKKKTQAKYNNSSVGQKNFSLNGTHRSQGWVGQTMLSRSLPKTPMKGQIPKGHGGCCGTYDKSHGIIQSAVTSLNNNNIIKASVIDNKGMLEEKITPYRNYLMPYPYVSTIPAKHPTCETVKSNSTHGTVGIYTENLATKNLNAVNNCVNNVKYSGCANYNPYYKRNMCTLVDKPANANGSIVHVDSTTNTEAQKASRLTCDDYINVTPDKYNEIYLRKGIKYNTNGTYVLPSNPTNGGVLPGPDASY